MKKEQIKAMVRKQKELNDYTNGISWVFGIRNKDNLINLINWCRCMHMEGSELLDSFPWKHWKDLSAKPDIQNAYVEKVDNWHFLLSYGIHTVFLSQLNLIKQSLKKESTVKGGCELYLTKTIDIEKLHSLTTDHKYSNLLRNLEVSDLKDINVSETEYNEFYNEIEDIIVDKILKAFDSIEEKHFEEIKKDQILFKTEKFNLVALMGSIEEEQISLSIFKTTKKLSIFESLLIKFFELSKQELFNPYFVGLYFGKNALNQFRQDNGYKEGTYKKHWFDGKEDNVHMMDIITKYDSFEEIYNQLTLTYNK